ncbi:MAG: ATP-binding protein [Oligoflexia bacterium]|nr:ATP-binding protein [Oligoflexia bacterium]
MSTIKRKLLQNLLKWKNAKKHKPLILRGARQTGKTFLVRELAKEFKSFLEINFEKDKLSKTIFESENAPKDIVHKISIHSGQTIIKGETLLFLDEIQESPESIKKLRYFYEEMPELHVIAAGSLLDFALEAVGVPVGRVEFLHLYPVSFLEFLEFTQNQLLAEEVLKQRIWDDKCVPLGEALHQKAMRLWMSYMAVGGMPEAVVTFLETKNFAEILTVHKQISYSYEQDFHKYARTAKIKYVDIIYKSVPRLLGQKFKYAHVSDEYAARELSAALDLLVKANVVIKIHHTSGNGIPLASEVNVSKFKTILLDVAISQNILGNDYLRWEIEGIQFLVNKGFMVESFVGQELACYQDSDRRSELFYWHRESKSSNAEVDYLINREEKIIPIEVKSGRARSAKGLQIFLEEKKKNHTAVMISSSDFEKRGRVINIPLYAVASLF